MYKGQYGEYAYWCKGVKGLILCSLNNLKPKTLQTILLNTTQLLALLFIEEGAFYGLYSSKMCHYTKFFLLLFPNNNKFCPFSGLKGPVIHMRSNSNWFYASRRSCIFSLRGLFSLNNCLSELNYGPLNAVHKNWCADNILNFLNLTAYYAAKFKIV